MSEANETTRLSQFLAEMRRRHVVRFALGYAAAAFVVLQLAEIVFPAFGIGEGGLRILVVVTGLSFPPALVLAWVYDITTEGIRRTGESPDRATSRLLARLALFALLVATVSITGALGLYLAQQGVFETAAPSTALVPPPGPVRTVAYDPSLPIRSLAVLPLDDFSPNQDQAYFTSGMHEELISRLGILQGIRVVSRTSVMRYANTTLTMAEIGRELDVDILVEGSVSRTPERTRVRLRLVHARSETTIQNLEWDREAVDDVLAFQTEVAHMVVHEIDSEHEEDMFVRTVASVAPAAQEAYFKGKYELDRGTTEGYRIALDHFEDAVDEDPDFASALAGLAGARFLIGLEDPLAAQDDMVLAQEEARAALALDSTSVQALDVLALINRSMPRIMEDETLLPAPNRTPKSMHVLMMPGQSDSVMIDMTVFDTAWVSAVTSLGTRIEENVRRRTMDRGEGTRRVALEARQLMTSGRYPEATEVLEALVLSAPEMVGGWEMLAHAHIASGDAGAAAVAVQQWNESGARGAPDDESAAQLQRAVETSGARGFWTWHLERLNQSDAAGGRVPRSELAGAHAALGNADAAFGYLLQALARGEPGIFSLRSDPAWDELRSDPRFPQLAREVRSMRFSPSRRGGNR